MSDQSPAPVATSLPCNIPGCIDTGVHRPVLLLRNTTNKAVARIPLPVVLCDGHRNFAGPEGFLDDAGWRAILAAADKMNQARPKRGLTGLTFIPVDAEEFIRFTAPRLKVQKP